MQQQQQQQTDTTPLSPRQTLLVLGAGFVGSRLADALTHIGLGSVFATHRAQFELEDRDSWHRLPPASAVSTVIITFPLSQPLSVIADFFDSYLSEVPFVVVYGTTSRYITTLPDQLVTEETPIAKVGRAEGEEYLRERGACCMVLAGIYGGQRQPYNWLNKGMIKNGNKHVNLIHVSDIVEITKHIIQHAANFKGQNVNISDGLPRQWKDIVEFYRRAGKVDPHFKFADETPADAQSKKISNEKVLRLMSGCGYPDQHTFSFHNLFEIDG